MQEIIKNFRIEGNAAQCSAYGCGHINRTYLVVTDSGKRYILQGINTVAFKDVPGLMENIGAVTRHLQKKVKSERECLHLVPTVDGADYWHDGGEGYWRMYDFVEDSICLQSAETPEDFYQSAVAFGTFQRQLEDFPAQTLHETIVNFHNTPDRYEKFKAVLTQDKLGRAKDAAYEIEEFLKREQDGSVLMDMLRKGELPLRVTHNDTKLNNVMLDAQTRKPLCVIDLDTVMPGLCAFDFGDSIRAGATTAAEDEADLSKVHFDLGLFEAYADGFLSAAGSALTPLELKTLPDGARLMTLEVGLRFLADYLNGDVYFRTAYPEHNLVRARNQFKLVQEMEEKRAGMDAVIAKYL